MEAKLKLVSSCIKSYPDFPKPGVLFRDIFSVLRDHKAFVALMDLMIDHVKNLGTKIDVIVGLESRGFILGPQMSLELGLPFVPLRKKGKLPGEVISAEFSLEYGSDVLEVQKGAIKPGQSVLVVDDLIATGGSLNAACTLIESLEASVTQCFAVMEIKELNGRSKIKAPVHTLISY